MTTPTEKMYAQCLGKLYTIPLDRWRASRWAVDNPNIPAPRPLVMPYRMAKHGGWWHFECDVLTNKEMYNNWHKSIGCKEFLRKAELYQIPAASSSEIA